jgi:hypothetical protein
MKINPAVTLVGFALALSASTPLLAHHSVAAEFDMTNRVTIQGTVTRVEFMNPHVRLWVDAKNADGTVSSWELELPPPNALRRMRLEQPFGNKSSANLFNPGDQLGVTLWRAKGGSLLGYALSLTFPDGRVLNLPSGWL